MKKTLIKFKIVFSDSESFEVNVIGGDSYECCNLLFESYPNAQWFYLSSNFCSGALNSGVFKCDSAKQTIGIIDPNIDGNYADDFFLEPSQNYKR